MRLALSLLACVCVCPAQTPAPLPQNWAGAGAAYAASSKPPVAGWFSYATLISQGAQAYSFTTHDIFLSQTRPYTVLSSIRTGIALVMRRAGPLTILGLGDAGVAAGGQSVGGAFSGGGIGILQLGKTDWTLCAAGRVIKTAGGGSQSVYELGFGRIF